MANKKKASSEMATRRFVRFYYRVDVASVFPEDPAPKARVKNLARRKKTEWQMRRANDLSNDVGELLGEVFDGVIVERCEEINPEYGLFVTSLITSILLEFKPDDFSGRKSKISAKALAQADREITGKIRGALIPTYRIQNLERILVASRYFVFEFTCEARLVVERTFTDAQIREAGGVSEAFEDFEREMEDAGQSVNVEISLSSSRRRRSDNRYVFSVFFRSNSGFSEEEVLGDLVSMYREKNANNSEDFGIELTDSAYQEGADSIKSELERAVSMELSYPDDVEFVAVGSFFSDSDEWLWDVGNEISV